MAIGPVSQQSTISHQRPGPLSLLQQIYKSWIQVDVGVSALCASTLQPMWVQRFTLCFMCVSRGAFFVKLAGTRIPEMSVSPTAHKSKLFPGRQVELWEAPKCYSLHTFENAVHIKKRGLAVVRYFGWRHRGLFQTHQFTVRERQNNTNITWTQSAWAKLATFFGIVRYLCNYHSISADVKLGCTNNDTSIRYRYQYWSRLHYSYSGRVHVDITAPASVAYVKLWRLLAISIFLPPGVC